MQILHCHVMSYTGCNSTYPNDFIYIWSKKNLILLSNDILSFYHTSSLMSLLRMETGSRNTRSLSFVTMLLERDRVPTEPNHSVARCDGKVLFLFLIEKKNHRTVKWHLHFYSEYNQESPVKILRVRAVPPCRKN